jgi:hypothetical protein
MAWEQHGICELAFKVFLLLVIILKFLLSFIVVPVVSKGLDWHSSAHGTHSSMS